MAVRALEGRATVVTVTLVHDERSASLIATKGYAGGHKSIDSTKFAFRRPFGKKREVQSGKPRG